MKVAEYGSGRLLLHSFFSFMPDDDNDMGTGRTNGQNSFALIPDPDWDYVLASRFSPVQCLIDSMRSPHGREKLGTMNLISF